MLARLGMAVAAAAAVSLTALGFSVGDRPVLKFATNEWLGYDPLYVAEDTGALDRGKIHTVALPSTTEVIRALRHGAIEGAALTLDEALTLAHEGMPLRIIAVADVSHGADAVLVRSDLPADATLEGKSIAYEGNAVGAFMLARFLSHHGLRLRDVDLRISPPDRHEEDLARGHLDAAVTYEPFVSRLKGATRILFSSAEIPGEIVDVLVVRSDLAHRHDLEHLRTAWLAGVHALTAGDAKALEGVAVRHRLELEELTAALKTVRFPLEQEQSAYLDGPSPRLRAVARLLWTVMGEAGLVPADTPMPTIEMGSGEDAR